MGKPERFLALADDMIRSMSDGDGQRAMRSLKRGRRALVKFAKVAGLMLLAAIVIPVAMITAGLLFGPRGVEGLIAAPLAVLTAWAAILFWALRARVTPKAIKKADLTELPLRTEEWLDAQRPKLPASTQSQLDAIAFRLEALAPQLRGLDPQLVEAREVRRLIGEELPELVHGWQKVPPSLRQQPLHDGPTPERRLIDALATIDEQIGRLHHRLAEGDLKSLATHQRYLEIKYKGDRKLE
jgi:hypothetical protein